MTHIQVLIHGTTKAEILKVTAKQQSDLKIDDVHFLLLLGLVSARALRHVEGSVICWKLLSDQGGKKKELCQVRRVIKATKSLLWKCKSTDTFLWHLHLMWHAEQSSSSTCHERCLALWGRNTLWDSVSIITYSMCCIQRWTGKKLREGC